MNNPFIKVTWRDNPENFTSEKIRRIKTHFQEKYGTKRIQIVTLPHSKENVVKLDSVDVSENITNREYQKKLMKDFITENKIDIKWELLERLDKKVNNGIDELNNNKVRHNKWFIKKIYFSNFLSFGDDNVLEFDKMNGITTIESNPKNFGGKSTISIDLLLFLFFNSTTKTKTNGEIFNKFRECDEVSVKGELIIDGDDYIIERKINRKKSRSNDYTIVNKLEFFKKNPDGTIINLNGEQRRETELFIESAIGNEEDFLTTILTTGYNLEQLIESKPTARGQILTKFIGLEHLKEKEDICKNIYNDWSKKLISNNYNIVDLEKNIEKYKNEIITLNNEKEKNNEKLISNQKLLKESEVERDNLYNLKNNDIDINLLKINVGQINNDIEDLKNKKESFILQDKNVIVKEPSDYYSEEEHNLILNNLNELNIELKLLENNLKTENNLLLELQNSEFCPVCKKPFDNVDNKSDIEKIHENLKIIQNDILNYNDKITKLIESNKLLTSLKNEYTLYERNKLIKEKNKLEINQKDLEINNLINILENYEKNKNKIEQNSKIDNSITIIKTKIETYNSEINFINNKLNEIQNNILNLNNKIIEYNDLITKIKSEQELMTIFKTYLTIYGKNGISKVILKNMIPLINNELYRLLIDSCYFILEMNINDKNEVEFLMIDNETRIVKPLNSGSGYEKTISSLALRSVLTKISSLPKPNIIVMDEVFGKVADENLEMVGEFFKKIKNYFEHIFLISHNPLIRNWSDNIIMVKKEDNISSIDYINTKI